MIAVALLFFMIPVHPSPADTGEVLYRAWCSSCHGADGRGVSKSMTRLEVPAADLADCATSSAETAEIWEGMVRDGGPAYGLSIDMPAFGANATGEQIEAVVRYARSLCREEGWPPGELNFPRAFLAEKAFPENEVVLVSHGREQALIYERRVGRRLQVEGMVRTTLDSGSVFDGVTGALKYNVVHSVRRQFIGSAGLEVTTPIGRQTEWEIEPYFAFGYSPASAVTIQGEFLATIEDGFGGVTMNLGIGREIGRLVPAIEGGWRVPHVGAQAFSVYPQLWIRLSRLGHVAGSIGAQLPLTGPAPRDPKLMMFLLWDFGDAPLHRGW